MAPEATRSTASTAQIDQPQCRPTPRTADSDCARSVATIAGAIRAPEQPSAAVQSATRRPRAEDATAIAYARYALPPVSTTAVAIEETARRSIRQAVGTTTIPLLLLLSRFR